MLQIQGVLRVVIASCGAATVRSRQKGQVQGRTEEQSPKNYSPSDRHSESSVKPRYASLEGRTDTHRQRVGWNTLGPQQSHGPRTCWNDLYTLSMTPASHQSVADSAVRLRLVRFGVMWCNTEAYTGELSVTCRPADHISSHTCPGHVKRVEKQHGRPASSPSRYEIGQHDVVLLHISISRVWQVIYRAV